MKLSDLSKLSRIQIVIYLFIIVASLTVLGGLISFVNDIFINPKKFTNELSMGGVDIPIMRPHQDVFFYINPEEIKNDASLIQKLKRNKYMFGRIFGISTSILYVLFLIGLVKLISSVKNHTFYNKRSTLNIKYIALILVLIVIVEFIQFQSLQFFIPLSVVQERINYSTLSESPLFNILTSVNFTYLLIAYAFYVISVVFDKVTELKEQTKFTI